jgi:GT2 family glycosyltransferase
VITVIVLTYNQREMTLSCLKSLRCVTSPPFQTLLWDNGSGDGTAEAVRQCFPEVTVHYHTTNLGVAGGRNAAAQMALERFDAEYLLFLDNDMLVEPSFVAELLAPLSADQSVGQTQAKLRFMDDRCRLNDGGGARIDFLRWQTTPVGFGEIDGGQRDEIARCIACGGAMMVRAGLFRQLGGFDNAFNPFGPEDLDFSLRLQRAGFRALYIPTAVAYHKVSHTFGRAYDEQYARLKLRHWLQFMGRHATAGQKVAFLVIGAPWLAVRVLVREARRGNARAWRGFLRGLLESLIAAKPVERR